MIQPSGALEHAKRLRELAQSVAGQPKEPDYYGEFNKAAITIEELAEQLAAAMAENQTLKAFALKLVDDEAELSQLDYWAEEYRHAYNALASITEQEQQLAAARAENEKLRQALYREGTIRTDLGGNKTYTNIDQKGGE